MNFNYTIEKIVGSLGRDLERGEDYYATEEYEYEYEVSDKQVAKALNEMHIIRNKPIEFTIKEIWEEVIHKEDKEYLLKEAECKTFEQLLLRTKRDYKIRYNSLNLTTYDYLNYILNGEIGNYTESAYDDLKEFFRETAEESFYESF